MSNYKVLIVLLALMLVFPVVLFCDSRATCLFLLIEPGSRPGGMSQAYVAQVDDALAGYWNPGAMAFNRKHQFSLMHSNWFGDVPGIQDMYYEYFGWNNYFEDLEGNLGFHVVYLSYGDQEHRSETNQDLGTFRSYELALAASYGYQYSDELGLGLTFKFILSDLAPSTRTETERRQKGRGMSYAFDFGVKKKNLVVDKLDFGANLQNVGPNMTFINESQSDPLPMNMRLGFSYRLLEMEYYKFTVNADMNKVLANDDMVLKRIFTAWYDDGGWQEVKQAVYGVGMEFTYLNLLSLRTGYFHDEWGEITGLNFGVGIEYTINNRYKASFDFAMQPGGEMLSDHGGYNKTFSLGLEF